MKVSFLALCGGNAFDHIGIQSERKYLHLYYYKSYKCQFDDFIMLLMNL